MTARRFDTSWGALPDGKDARFRLWAPGVEGLAVEVGGRQVPMRPQGEGWFEAHAPATAGDSYRFVLPDGMRVPDPAARAQMAKVGGPSRLVDPAAYEWSAQSPARPWEEAAIHEIHVGTFTEAGTFAAAAERMPHLAEVGFTAVEIMPVAQFDGTRGWGYDGVLLYAPHPAYGTPEEMKAMVEAAHRAGLMVLLDVVYNHFGPEGNYLGSYAPDFFDSDRQTPWGAGIDYAKGPVRRFYVENALYWLEEFDLDGLRLDAIDHIRDPSETELLVEIAQAVREARGDRPTWLTTEDNRNVTHLHEEGLYDGEWNDDVHNAIHVIATGEIEGYYGGFAEAPARLLARALAEGFAFQGAEGDPYGQPSAHLPPAAFVDFVQNHDQIGNRAMGDRLSTLVEPDVLDALQALHLLSPHVPLTFMGEEWGETRPFLFFTDFDGDLADAVREGRRREFAAFEAFSDEAARAAIPDPNDPETFARSRIDWTLPEEDEDAAATLERTRMLLRLRRERLVPLLAGAGPRAGRVIGAEPGQVDVDWTLGGGVLWQLRANLGQWPRAMARASGERVFGPAPGVGGELPPWSVAYYLDENPPEPE